MFLLFVYSLHVLCTLVSANTEIVNFAAPESPEYALDFTQEWSILAANQSETYWTLTPAPLGTPFDSICATMEGIYTPCTHELWLKLDLDSSAYNMFTLRLSWPAWFPVDTQLETFSGHELASIFPNTVPTPSFKTTNTRRRFARIRMVDTGFVPSHQGARAPETVEFVLRLEPLFLGFLPLSMAPVVAFLAVLLVIVARYAQFAVHYFGQQADLARKELKAKKVKQV